MEIKLEEEENHKGLILDPQRDHHLHLYKQLLDSTKQLPTAGGGSTFHGLHQHHDQLQQQTHAGVAAAAAGGSTAPPHPPQPQNNNNNNKRSYSSSFEYAPEKMGESYQFHNQQLQQNQQPTGSSRLRNTGGEIVEVQGGHIVRSTGRKDRHSKVCTAKGPRDRRVRLSAHTAIQFYDVQDRLGYDRPSKAVDWLIKKAKSAIDELAELPAWKPTATPVPRNANPNSSIVNFDPNPEQLGQFEQHPDDNIVDSQMGRSQNSSFLPPSLDSDSIADTIKSFFPMGASSNPANNNNNNSSSGMQFHQSFTPSDLISRGSNTNSNRSQDLRLSLQSFQDPILQNHHHQQGDSNSNNNNMYFDGSGWPDTPSGGFQRMVTWGGDAVFSSQPTTQFLQPLFAQNQTQTQTTNNHQLFNNNSQRGPLQSSTAPSFRAWIDPPPPFTGVAIDQHPTLAFHHPSNMPVFASGLGGFSGFRVPARIQGQEEEHDGISDRPSSASSDSHH